MQRSSTRFYKRLVATKRTQGREQRKFHFKKSFRNLNRRKFLSIVGGSIVLGGALTGCAIVLAEDVKSSNIGNNSTRDKAESSQPRVLEEEAREGGCPFPFNAMRKPSLIIVGSGWAAISVLKQLGDDYDVTLVSPKNYFLFTPLLPSVTVGSIEPRSIVEPIRRYFSRLKTKVRFYEAKCVDVNPVTHAITCQYGSGDPSSPSTFKLHYDKLVIAVGAYSNTFGVQGVSQHANFLKDIEDAQEIRTKIMNCFESANIPGLSERERRDLLRFVVVGGGPTGVEYAAELNDFLVEDLSRYFPHLMADVSLVLIQSGDHILNTFDKKISIYTEEKFKRDKIDVRTNARVKEVNEKEVLVTEKGKETPLSIPYGTLVWSTGLSPNPLVTKLTDAVPEQQHSKGLKVDSKLQVRGVKDIYALGDCAIVEAEKLIDHLVDLFKIADTDGDNQLSNSEFKKFLSDVEEQYPQLAEYNGAVMKYFLEADKDKNNQLSIDEFRELMQQADNKLKTLPTTAQVASQQGKYLGESLNALARNEVVKPFKYKHFGSFAYTGRSAVAELPGDIKTSGFMTWFLWRGIFLANQQTFKNKVMISWDWLRTFIFGRDISRF
eukprot:TRINITY_DN4782_c0_g7_i1.p1 TRINITY_DN4782_c0_g7~~TRINITY_DN4782_c0_g7_i1.p1  ORF type:complete len:606 (-),score=98.54 TRINITY_DN4782_c0_g7_i1:2-1819(-)